jgi:predicted ATP-grasp superfamily ATP-dependent carboligase
MNSILIELKNKKAYKELHNLEEQKLIRIVKEKDNEYSLVLPGKPIDADSFRKWIEYIENTPTISLTEAKYQWELQKKKLAKLIR